MAASTINQALKREEAVVINGGPEIQAVISQRFVTAVGDGAGAIMDDSGLGWLSLNMLIISA